MKRILENIETILAILILIGLLIPFISGHVLGSHLATKLTIAYFVIWAIRKFILR